MTWVESDRVIELRARAAPIDVGVGVLHGFTQHQTSRNAAVLTYYGFLSIFPLFMVAASVLGFVLQGNERLQAEILDTAAAQIPVLGSQIEREAGQISGSVTTVVVGLLIALWAATRAFAGVQNAFDDVWEVSIADRDNLAVRRVKAVVGIMVIGSGLVITTIGSSLVSSLPLPAGGRILLALGAVAVNTLVLWTMLRYLTAATIAWRASLPGAVFGGVAFTTLQVLGTFIVTRFLASADDTAGVFAGVFALMAWINLHAMVSLIAAELNAALLRRRTRRSDVQLWLSSEFEHPAIDHVD